MHDCHASPFKGTREEDLMLLLGRTPKALDTALNAILTEYCPECGRVSESLVPTDWHLAGGDRVFVREKGVLWGKSTVWPVEWPDSESAAWVALLQQSKTFDFSHKWGGWRFRVQAQVRHIGSKPLVDLFVRRVPQTLPAQLRLPRKFMDVSRDTPRGLVVISGATGSGKSTTMAMLTKHILNAHNQEKNGGRHIIEYANPIEYEHQSGLHTMIRQYELGRDYGSFEQALGEQLLRKDPEIVMPAEIRSPRAIRGALDAADTGHLVISTLHLSTAPTVAGRIITDAGPDYASKLPASLQIIICQTLVQSRFGGRIAAFEQLAITPSVRTLLNKATESGQLSHVTQGLDSAVIAPDVRGDSFSMEHSLAALIEHGHLSAEEAYSYAPRQEFFRRSLPDLRKQVRNFPGLMDLYRP